MSSSLLLLPEELEMVLNDGDGDGVVKSWLSSLAKQRGRVNVGDGGRGVHLSPPADILITPKEYIFYIDVPGLSKSDIQVQLEEENILVIKSSPKRKREDGEMEGCKYLKLERRTPFKMMRKFRLPQDADASTVAAKCENGVLSVTVQKVPPAKPKTVQIAIS